MPPLRATSEMDDAATGTRAPGGVLDRRSCKRRPGFSALPPSGPIKTYSVNQNRVGRKEISMLNSSQRQSRSKPAKLDDVGDAPESGEPREQGRSRGRVIDDEGEGTGTDSDRRKAPRKVRAHRSAPPVPEAAPGIPVRRLAATSPATPPTKPGNPEGKTRWSSYCSVAT